MYSQTYYSFSTYGLRWLHVPCFPLHKTYKIHDTRVKVYNIIIHFMIFLYGRDNKTEEYLWQRILRKMFPFPIYIMDTMTTIKLLMYIVYVWRDILRISYSFNLMKST